MLHDLMRQRRRIAFAVLFTQLASLWIWHGIVMIAIMALCVMAVSIIVVHFAKDLRQSVECGAVGFYAAAMMPPILMIPMFVAISVLTYGIFYTSFLDRLPGRIGLRSRKRFHAPFDRRTTWAKVVPGQGHSAAHWTGTMISAVKDADDDNTLYLKYEGAANQIEYTTLTYLTLNPFFTASYLIERDTHVAGEEIVLSYTFAKAGNEKTTILSDMQVSGLPIRLALLRFFDDVLGDELDSFATMSDCQRSWRFRDAKSAHLTDDLEGVAENVQPLQTLPQHDEDAQDDYGDDFFDDAGDLGTAQQTSAA
jgi:hypothetical protein